MNVFSFIKNIFFPPECVLCGSIMEPNSETYVCGKCWTKLNFCSVGVCCQKCGKPIVSFAENPLCYFCVDKKSRYFDRIVSVFEYDGIIRRSVMRYKDFGLRNYADVYAQLMSARFYEEYEGIDFDYICGAPSHKNRKKDKGFEPVDKICVNLSEILGIRYCKNLLIKTRNTEKQGRLAYKERLKNLVDSMEVNETFDVSDKIILLIDDVCTTRSTITECARTLKKKGAKKVFALTFATTVKDK